jgi:hypothetical protein
MALHVAAEFQGRGTKAFVRASARKKFFRRRNVPVQRKTITESVFLTPPHSACSESCGERPGHVTEGLVT